MENKEFAINEINSFSNQIIENYHSLLFKSNIIQRDIKPDNILIKNDKLIIADFDIFFPRNEYKKYVKLIFKQNKINDVYFTVKEENKNKKMIIFKYYFLY